MRRALESIRPYRLGPDDEPIESLYERIQKEIGRQADDADIDDIEEIEDDIDKWEPDPVLLANLLTEGVALLHGTRDLKWQAIYDRLLRTAGREKVVLFAQPIETVTALARYLENVSGTRPALIIGDQSQADRDQEIANFWKPDGPQFLVSSRAGGEGINLRVARSSSMWTYHGTRWSLSNELAEFIVLVSELILVDTVVAKDSREVDMYRVARARLHLIASSLVPQDRFESLFARVMSLVSGRIAKILAMLPWLLFLLTKNEGFLNSLRKVFRTGENSMTGTATSASPN